MRSAILVDAVLNFEVRGDHIYITDEGGAVHLALSRGTFAANLARAKAVYDGLGTGCRVHQIAEGNGRVFREEVERY